MFLKVLMELFAKKAYFCAVFAFMVSVVFSVSYASGPETFIGEITGDDINIRSDSTAGAESLAKVNKGQRVEIVSESYDWYKIRLPPQVACFVKKEFVDVSGPGNGVVNEENVNVRFFYSGSSIIAGRAEKNEPVSILGEINGWYKINPVRNSFGWVHKKFVRKAAVKNMPQALSPVLQIPASIPFPEATPVKTSEEGGEIQFSLIIPDVSKPSAVPEESLPAADAENTVTLIGLVKSYGNVINRPATHKLITKEKKVYLLKYRPAVLDELVFHTVRITGRQFSLPKTKFPVIEIDKIDILD
ncbi:MAG: SH3 domain-containing protein [Candidatus Omnitrophica bacterium]|nr:SH3 domain-containing protein [Candidatus Omnitrophota bacterium]